MRIIDEAVLEEFRTGGPCEYCGHRCLRRHPHHIFCRGMGGGSRLDVRENLCSVCFGCHIDIHMGVIPLRSDDKGERTLLSMVGKREGKSADEIEAIIFALLRAPKRSIA